MSQLPAPAVRSMPHPLVEGTQARVLQTPNQVSSIDAPLSDELRAYLLAEIDYLTAAHLEEAAAIVDGAVLGAEQVQDKRLEWSEDNMALSTDQGESFATFALQLVISELVGGPVASLLVRQTLAPLLRTAAAGIVNARRRSELGVELANLFREEAMAMIEQNQQLPERRRKKLEGPDQLKELAKELLSADRTEARKLAKTAESTISSLTGSLTSAVAKQVTTETEKLVKSETKRKRDAGTSPGVILRDAAMASASELRLTIAATGASVALEAHRPDLTMADAQALLEGWRPIHHDVGSVREAIARASEAHIWARLLVEKGALDVLIDRSKESGKDPSFLDALMVLARAITVGDPLIRLDVAREQEAYFEARFGDDILRWANSTGQRGEPYRGRYAPMHPAEWAPWTARWFFQLSKEVPDYSLTLK